MAKTIHVSATVEQVAIIDRLVAEDARPGEDPKRARSRWLVGLALAEHERRTKGKVKR